VSDLATDLLQLASDLAVTAGKLVSEGRRAGVQRASTKSSATDVVTEFDRASERLIVEGITRARPHDALMGEEGATATGTSGIEWLIDPIDGTTNFLYDLPGYAVSIAALADSSPLIGVVYVPASGELFTAVAGRGAFLDGSPIRCSTTATLDQALVATGFSYQVERRRSQGARFAAMIPKIRDIRRLGAASTDLCYLACGRVDLYFEQWLAPWDWAAGELIAREAGCRTGRFDGGPLDASTAGSDGGSEVLAANPMLFDPMIELLAVTEPGRNPGIM
jgi:myo-inositol-1(or 4)-monophosphatase